MFNIIFELYFSNSIYIYFLSSDEMNTHSTAVSESKPFIPELYNDQDYFQHACVFIDYRDDYASTEIDEYTEENDFRKITVNIEYILAVLHTLIQKEIAKISESPDINIDEYINEHYLKQMYKLFARGYIKLKSSWSIFSVLLHENFDCEPDNRAWNLSNDMYICFDKLFECICKHMVYCTIDMRNKLKNDFGLIITHNFVLCENSEDEPVEETYLSESEYKTAMEALQEYETNFKRKAHA